MLTKLPRDARPARRGVRPALAVLLLAVCALLAVGATTIYRSSPDPGPMAPQVPGPESPARQTGEPGDQIQLAGMDHVLQQIHLVMSDWDPAADAPSCPESAVEDGGANPTPDRCRQEEPPCRPN